MILYVGTKQKSSWSLRPYLALAHAGIPFETKTIFLDRPSSKAEIAAVSAAGRVPVLHDGALVIHDSLAICEYAAELVPHLWPADRATRAKARAISCEMHSGFAALRRDMSMDILTKLSGVGHTDEALADAARVMAIWRQALAVSGGPFLFGHFSIADAMFAPVATRFMTYGVPLDAPCHAYVEVILAHPAFLKWKREATDEIRTRLETP